MLDSKRKDQQHARIWIYPYETRAFFKISMGTHLIIHSLIFSEPRIRFFCPYSLAICEYGRIFVEKDLDLSCTCDWYRVIVYK